MVLRQLKQLFKNDNPYGAIAEEIGIVTLILVIVLSFSLENEWVIVPVVGFMVLLGIALAYFQSRKK